MQNKENVKSLLMLIPGITVVIACIFAVNIRASALDLDKETMDVLKEVIESAEFNQGMTPDNGSPEKPKINKSAAASAKGLAAGSAVPQAANGASRSIDHNNALDNAEFKDGTYTGSAQGFNGPVTVKVVIKDGKIKSVSIVSNSDTPSYFNRARKLTSSIVSKQSTKVDSVSGATYSSNGIIKATERALMKAAGKPSKAKKAKKPAKQKKSRRKDKVSKKKYKDGTYTGSAKGYRGDVKVKVTVKNGKIAKVKVVSHTDTPSYFSRAKKLIPKITKNNNPNVDTVSGATFSSKGIINAVKDALKKASGKKPDKKPKPDEKPDDTVSDTKYENGVYEGKAVGYTGGNGLVCMTYATVTVENNKIAKIELESQDPTLSGDDWYWKQVYPKIPDAIVKKNDPNVDAVSGATMSSNGIMNAVKDALKGHELKEQSENSAGKALNAAAEDADPEQDESKERKDNDQGEQHRSEPAAPVSTSNTGEPVIEEDKEPDEKNQGEKKEQALPPAEKPDIESDKSQGDPEEDAGQDAGDEEVEQ